MLEYTPDWTSAFLWAVILAYILALLVAFGMGANDCANSYGTVVGSGVLKLYQAYIMATVFETLGAVTLGYKVIETMRKLVVNVTVYDVHIYRNETLDKYVAASDPTQCPAVNVTSNASETGLPWIHWDGLGCTKYTQADFLMGELGALAGTAFWLIFATVFQFPVSTTHSAVGATVGFSLVLKGPDGINWITIWKIVGSWFLSPLLAGFISICFYLFIKYTCLKRTDPFESSLRMLPIFYFAAITVNIFSISMGKSRHLKLDKLSWWHCLLISLAVGTPVALLVLFWGKKVIRERVLRTMRNASIEMVPAKEMDELKKTTEPMILEGDRVSKGSDESFPVVVKKGTDSGVGFTPSRLSTEPTAFPSTNTVATGDSKGAASALLGNSKSGTKATTPKKQQKPTMVDASCLQAKLKALKDPIKENLYANQVFNYLQILSACFLSFSHGSNDTANAVGPLVGLWLTYKTGDALTDAKGDAIVEFVIILFGAAGMIIGLWVLGHKVIQTIGSNLVAVTPPSGFAMELGTAFTVLFASQLGIPVSTTHCAVGAVISVGWLKSHKGGVSWKTFRNIAIAWIVTLPVAGAVSALVAYLLNHFVVGT